jgi:hypothetical protein
MLVAPAALHTCRAKRHKEIVMSVKFTLVDLGHAKKETRFGFFFPPTDGINALFF